AGSRGDRGAHGTGTQVGAVEMTTTRPVQEFYSIGEVCSLTDLKPHVLRYWESQFRFLNPAKNRSGNRVYKGREVELIMLVKHLLYTEKFTIDGARQRIDHYRRTGELKVSARRAFEAEMAQEIRTTVEEVLGILDGKVIKRDSGAGGQEGSNSTPPEPKA
ncbi:MAG: regulatory protein MerR, partial [Geminicoccaceae bacterium]|nr:regulatory protein MerR [Geminicoccaceae bacterium]